LNKNEEVIPTHHKKIMISRVNNAGINNTINNNIDYLIELASQNKNVPVVKQMKRIVREFISKNSVYEKLDEEQKLDPVQVIIEN